MQAQPSTPLHSLSRPAPWRLAAILAALALAVLFALGGAARAQSAEAEYRIGPGDKLNITVFGQSDLSGPVVVDGSGRISFPLLGLIDVNGKTVAELQAEITDKLNRDFLVDPKVSIEIVNHRPFFILGQVNKPGSYPYIEGMTVRMAVALAGGFTRRARESPVTLIRGGDPERKEIEADLDAPVLPGDTIQVERRLF